MEKIERKRNDRNWIKFRISGAVSALKALPANSLSNNERAHIDNAVNSLEEILERFTFTSQMFGIRKYK